MKTQFAALVAITLGGTASALAADYTNIPAPVRAQIKAKCVATYPDDYGMQNGCIIVQSDSFLAVEGYAPPLVEANGWVRGQITNAAQASAFETLCGKRWADFDGPGAVADIKAMVMEGKASNSSTITPKRFDALVREEAATLVAMVEARPKVSGVFDVCVKGGNTGFDGKPVLTPDEMNDPVE